MKTLALIAGLALALAGCARTDTETATDSSGQTVRVEKIVSNTGFTDTFRLSSGPTLVCEGNITWPRSNIDKADWTMPLICNDGTRGTATVQFPTRDRLRNANMIAVFSYTLADGRTGTVRV